MRFGRIRLWLAGLVAFVFGFPLTQKALAGAFDVVESSFELGFAIADSARGS